MMGVVMRSGKKESHLKHNAESDQPLGAKMDESPSIKNSMKTALFTNFTDADFTGYWDGKGKKFIPGQSLYMPDYLAQHFAKHLTNRELLKVDRNGTLVYKDGEKMTSPKNPEQSPIFMKIFNQAYTPDEEEEEALGDKKDDIDTLINVANKNRNKKLQNKAKSEDNADDDADDKSARVPNGKPAKQDPKKPQVVLSPDFDDDEDEEFEGKEKVDE